MGCPHAATEATEAASPEATEAATAASRLIAGTPTHGYEPDVLIFSAGLGGAQWQTSRMMHPVRLRRNPVI
jgi:hypothetical protein